MGKAVDISGQRFGMLTAMHPLKNDTSVLTWRFKCDCGNLVDRQAGHVRANAARRGGKYISCGCINHSVTHGLSYTRLYRAWVGMRSRCYHTKTWNYSDYGGRGIRVCDAWLNDAKEFCVWAMANGYEPGLTLERRDVDGNYCPENCTWVTKAAQNGNTRNTVWLTYDGVRKRAIDWADERGIPHRVIRRRISELGWSPEKAIVTPYPAK